MDRQIVSSSNIVSVGYDAASETLEVEFQNGSIYQYYNVGQSTYDEFIAAPSKGKFLAYQIKNAFPYSRV
jgi:KTSC domain